MREIKFRIWNGAYFDYWGFVHDKHGVHFSSPSSNNEYPMTYEDRENRSEQFTGLCDKDGRKIYEGDIVKAPGLTGEIIYSERWAEFKLLGANSVGFYPDIEVIGNIHENLELLEVRNEND